MKVRFQVRRSNRNTEVRRGERGVALIIALLCMLVISILAAAVVFSAQTEVRTSANYRYTTQARYVAEAGAQQAIRWVAQNWTPPSNFTDTTKFNLKVFPALYVGGTNPQKIVFASSSGLGSITDTYSAIDNTLDTSFKNNLVNVSSPFSSIGGTASFNSAVQLLSATQVTVAGGSQWLTKWKVISQGTVGPGYNSGNGLAKVQVVEIMADVPTNSASSQTVPNFNYAVLATGTGCNVIQMTGGSNPTNAYNSQASGNPGNSNPTTLGTGGNVASYGNIYIHNGAHINGTVFSPFYNAGNAGTNGISCPAWTSVCGSNSSGWNTGQSCSSPSKVWSVNEDNSGSAVGCTNGSSCTQSVVNLPSSIPSPSAFPTPTMPSVTPNTSACTALAGGLCNGGNGGGGGCAATMPPSPNGTSYGAVNFGSCAVITLQAGVYNFDTLLISNGAKINLPSTGNVVINIMNTSSSSPFTTNGGTVTNGGGDPNNLTFVYAGSNTINLNNGSALFATIYAPNAPVTVSGNGGLFGSVVGKTFNFSGSGHVVYDTHLASQTPHVYYGGTAVVYTPHLDEFSWSAY